MKRHLAAAIAYAAYNEIEVDDKAIVHGIGMTHNCFSKFYEELGRWATARFL